MNQAARPAVPIERQVVFYAAEVAKAEQRLQRAVNGREMRPDTMDFILKNMRSVLWTLREAEKREHGQ